MLHFVFNNFSKMSMKKTLVSLLFFTILYPLHLHAEDVVFVKLNTGGGSGLGNQMFQFAAAYSLAKRMGVPLKIVTPNAKAADLKNTNDRQYTINNSDFHLDGIEFVSEEEFNKAPCFSVWEHNYFHDLKGKGRINVVAILSQTFFSKIILMTLKKSFL